MLNEAPGLERDGYSPGIPPLFHSRREIALLKDKSASPGFGYLKQGTILGIDQSTLQVVPVPVDDGSVDAIDIARSRVTLDYSTGTSVVSVSEEDAAKYSVGDAVVLSNLTPIYADMGTVVSKAAPAGGSVVITVTGSVAEVAFTIANRAALSHKTAASDPFYAASCVLDKDLNVGTSAEASAVPTSVVFGNCILYTAFLTGLSAKSITDLGAIQDGLHTIIK